MKSSPSVALGRVSHLVTSSVVFLQHSVHASAVGQLMCGRMTVSPELPGCWPPAAAEHLKRGQSSWRCAVRHQRGIQLGFQRLDVKRMENVLVIIFMLITR